MTGRIVTEKHYQEDKDRFVRFLIYANGGTLVPIHPGSPWANPGDPGHIDWKDNVAVTAEEVHDGTSDNDGAPAD